jgi:hypothetical protein
MGDRRPHRRPSWRVREAIGSRRGLQRDDELIRRLTETGDFSPAALARMAELLGQNGPRFPPDATADQI